MSTSPGPPTTRDGRAIDVTFDPGGRRWTAAVAGTVVAHLEFVPAGDDRGAQPGTGTIVFTHTEVDPALGGQGVGSVLVRGALADLRSRHGHAMARCPFVRAFVERDPAAWADVVTLP